MTDLHSIQLDPIITRALEEDWGFGDWTTDICVPGDKTSHARIVAKEPAVVAGLDVATAVFRKVDPELAVKSNVTNGAKVESGDVLLEIVGASRSILKAERVALNLMARMCGIATMARAFKEQLDGTGAQLLDTRKTTPGLRILEKSAAVTGGARNHRFSLCDGVIVKENHIRAAGGIKIAVGKLLESLPPTLKVEVEVTSLDEVHEALEAGAHVLMLDNMSVAEMTMAVRTVRGRALVEASGNVRLENVRKIAEAGVNFISTSAVFHSSKWTDLSLLFDMNY